MLASVRRGLANLSQSNARAVAPRAKSNPLEGWVSQSRGQSEFDNGEFSEASRDRLHRHIPGAPTATLEVRRRTETPIVTRVSRHQSPRTAAHAPPPFAGALVLAVSRVVTMICRCQ